MSNEETREISLRLNVFFTPSEILPGETAATATGADDIYIVVDVIRATTSMAVMFDQGAERIYVAGSIEQAKLDARGIGDPAH